MNLFKKVFISLVFGVILLHPTVSFAGNNLIDALDLSPFVPIVLDALMLVATGTYDFFVGQGDGIIFTIIWLFLAISFGAYLLKMYFPKNVLGFIGINGGGEMWENKAQPMTIAHNMLKPVIRAMVAVTILLPIKPDVLTKWVVNPFLQFGSIYTTAILSTINEAGIVNHEKVKCPESIIQQKWLTQSSCEFLTQSVADLSHANNKIIKRGFDFLLSGLRGMMTLIPHGGEDFLNIISGLIIIFTFVGCNLFMALLVIQAIFNFGVALIIYPFGVFAWVAKQSDKWFDPLPPFSGIIKALQELVITMIACAFILGLNVALIKALFQWDSSIFVVAAGGTATMNVPMAANTAMGFGQHSIFWMSSILTFFVMQRIFEVTRQTLNSYTKGMDGMYNQVKADAKTTVTGATKTVGAIKDIVKWARNRK